MFIVCIFSELVVYVVFFCQDVLVVQVSQDSKEQGVNLVEMVLKEPLEREERTALESLVSRVRADMLVTLA